MGYKYALPRYGRPESSMPPASHKSRVPSRLGQPWGLREGRIGRDPPSCKNGIREAIEKGLIDKKTIADFDSPPAEAEPVDDED